jgi:hypothetical protein
MLIGLALSGVELACAREACCKGSKAMSKLGTEAIFQVASTNDSIRNVVARELLVSWPIPRRIAAEHVFAFFYYASWGPPPAKSSKLYPPQWRVEILEDGRPGKPERVEPKALGIDAPPAEPFATHAWPATWTVDQASEKRRALLAAYDAVLPIWLQRGSSSAPSVVAFRRQFLELTEPPLLPVYLTLGPDFFAWVGVAKPGPPSSTVPAPT